MNTIKHATVALAVVGIIGCSSGGSDPASSSSEATVNDTFVGTSNDTNNPEPPTGGNEQSDNTQGISPGDPNPGAIPDPVLSELTTINVLDLGGHKIFAGPEQLKDRPTTFGYFNMNFDCGGTGTFEGFIQERYAFVFDNVKGTVTWEAENDDSRVLITITELIEGAFGSVDKQEISTSNLEGRTGNLIAGQSTMENSIITRIVQYTEC